MRIAVANHSGFPSSGEDPEERLAAALRAQEDSGVDWVTDGECSGASLVEILMQRLDGVRAGSPLSAPFFATAFHQPRVQAKLRHRKAILAPRLRRAAAVAQRPLKAVLCGPYTLAQSSSIETTAYASAAALAADLSAILATEVRSLVECGVRLVQVEEPMILSRPQDVRLLRELLEPLQTAVEPVATLAVATYGTDAVDLYAQLNSLPGEMIAVDCAASPRLIDLIAAVGSGKRLALGLVDGRRAARESPAACSALLERALRRYEHESVMLQPSCGMESLDGAAARAKLAVLVALRQQFSPGA